MKRMTSQSGTINNTVNENKFARSLIVINGALNGAARTDLSFKLLAPTDWMMHVDFLFTPVFAFVFPGN